jgi:hypothetical protein
LSTAFKVAIGNQAKSGGSNLAGTTAREDVRPVQRTLVLPDFFQTSRAVQRDRLTWHWCWIDLKAGFTRASDTAGVPRELTPVMLTPVLDSKELDPDDLA